MESKERCVAVFDGDVPDRAPVCDFGNAAMLGYTGHTLDECRKSPSLVKEIMGKWVADTGADLFFGPIETKGIFMDLPGMEVKLPENDQGSLKSAYFTCPEDVDSKELYDPLDAKSCPNLHRYVIDMLRAVEQACPDVMTAAWCEGVLTTTGFLRGVEDLLMLMLMEPDEAKKVITRGADFSRDIVTAELEEIDADYIVYTDPVSSASMIDDNMFREFNRDLLKRNIEHWSGNTSPMLNDFAMTGAAAMSLDHAVDLRDAKAAFGDTMAVMGNIDPVSIMLNGTPDDVRAVTTSGPPLRSASTTQAREEGSSSVPDAPNPTGRLSRTSGRWWRCPRGTPTEPTNDFKEGRKALDPCSQSALSISLRISPASAMRLRSA